MRSRDGQRTWRIGELAAELGMNPRTLRYYEAIGLIPPPRRTSSGYRLYGSAERERLRFICKARAIGLSLSEIREILRLRDAGREPCEHVIAMLDRKIADLDRQIRALERFRRELQALRRRAARRAHRHGAICGIIEHAA
ncbi:heavy metal-responsive transcriptional regulator [Thermoflexus sp.]|uniref:heavy metal-responsive transcriptional regulator n=1 Tax=Thermoflexus sp. TaxID=1969742 RepID=UPI0018548367|nr:heavy metal-responsive transcriptional regulator [Thermoflexus sp.]